MSTEPTCASDVHAPFMVSPDQLPTEDELAEAYAKWVLMLCNGNKTRAARVLGFSRKALYRRLGFLEKKEREQLKENVDVERDAGDRPGNE